REGTRTSRSARCSGGRPRPFTSRPRPPSRSTSGSVSARPSGSRLKCASSCAARGQRCGRSRSALDVAVEEPAEARDRGLDVLLALRAERLVALLDRRVRDAVGALVRDAEERVRDPVLPRGEVLVEGRRLSRGDPLRIERLELVDEAVEETVDGVLDETRLDRLHRLVGGLDRDAGETALRADLLVDE